MNCPMTFASTRRSRTTAIATLPVRLAEFGTVYRWEKSGELGGMTRVRGLTQDDAHLFCHRGAVATGTARLPELVKIILGTLGMKDYRVRVGCGDPDSKKYVGSSEQWDKGETSQGGGRVDGCLIHRRAG